MIKIAVITRTRPEEIEQCKTFVKFFDQYQFVINIVIMCPDFSFSQNQFEQSKTIILNDKVQGSSVPLNSGLKIIESKKIDAFFVISKEVRIDDY